MRQELQPKRNSKKRYIGDGVYLDHDGFAFVLTTENGMSAQNTIYLEPDIWENLKCQAETILVELEEAEHKASSI